MKRWIGIAALLALVGFAPGAHAQSLGPWTGAEIMPSGGHAGGVYLDTGDDAIGALGQLRMSFYPNVDFGFQGGLSRLDQSAGDRTVVRVGGDLRAGLLRVQLLRAARRVDWRRTGHVGRRQLQPADARAHAVRKPQLPGRQRQPDALQQPGALLRERELREHQRQRRWGSPDAGRRVPAGPDARNRRPSSSSSSAIRFRTTSRSGSG